MVGQARRVAQVVGWVLSGVLARIVVFGFGDRMDGYYLVFGAVVRWAGPSSQR